MKLLYIIDSLGLGGKERQLLELLGELEKIDKYNICLVVLSKNKYYEKIDKLNIDKYFIERTHRKDIKSFFKILEIARQFKPDIIHSWELMCSIYAAPVAKITGSRFVNGFIRRAPTAPSLTRPRLTYLFSDRILSNSFAGLKSYHVPLSKACCIHNGFDFNRVAQLGSVETTKRRFDIETQKVVGMVARFHPRKHFECFIKSAKEVLGIRDDVTFVTVGDGETLESCKQAVDSNHMERVRFLGSQKEVESIINIFDIGVLLSMEEGISNALMEYMAQGKPVIATNHGGNNELVQNNETGFLVAPRDVSKVTECLLTLLENQELANDMGRKGKKRLISEFGMEKMVDRYIALYEGLSKPLNRV
jgi:glycosyltransferase involved in cell wall biosynthesis